VTKTYGESTNAPTKHSPILAWTADGFPLYGPYGYSNATNANGGIRRMISGYVLRNGQYGTDNLPVTGRTTIPQWAVRLYNVSSNQTGAPFTGIHTNGCYMEDNDYLGDHGYTQGVDFDLDEYNGRFCVTPEFPNGTYAYFVAISSNGAPVFPYNIGRAFYGNPSGGTVTSIAETVTTNFLGGTSVASKLNPTGVGSGTVTLTWSAVEGGSYQVESTTNFSTWIVLATNVSPNQILGGYTNATTLDKNFYRVGRTAVASYDSFSGTGGFVAPGGSVSRGSGTNISVTITLPANPPQPPAGNVPASVTLAGTITGTGVSRPSVGTVVATFAISAAAPPGAQNIVIVFNPAPTYTMTGAFTINP
jgi:YHYH protein